MNRVVRLDLAQVHFEIVQYLRLHYAIFYEEHREELQLLLLGSREDQI